MTTPASSRLAPFVLPAIVGAISGVLTVLLLTATGVLGGGTDHEATRAYLIENPDILPEMAQAYDMQQARERLAQAGGAVTEPFPGAVLGNPDGAVTLVEFTDYGCGFCRQSRADVEALIAANPDLRVVVREWPIFDGSEGAARMALAAAEQGKFAAFHAAMFAGDAPSAASVKAAATMAGLDMARADTFLKTRRADAELAANIDVANRLGFTGTPSWVVGDTVVQGAVGQAELQAAITAARADT